jgi:hypothetical protein
MSIIFDNVTHHFSPDAVYTEVYAWDSWQSTSYFMFLDEALLSRLAPLSDNAVIGFGLAMTEWICARYFREMRSLGPLEYIDSVWAGTLQDIPVAFVEFADADWQGPILGPLRFAQLIAADLQFEAQADGGFAARACWAYHLAVHVLGSQRAVFAAWADASLQILSANHKRESPRWVSIFDTEFIAERKCPPDAFCRHDSYNPDRIDQYIAEHSSRIMKSTYLTEAL